MIKFTKGEAKEMVKTYIQLPPEVWFKTAKILLHERYEDPHRITAACRNQIKKLPQIKPGDSDVHRKFQNFLIKCKNIDQMQGWNVLNTPNVVCILASKLPENGRDRWSRKVLAIRKHKREPDMMDFIQFVNDESVIVTNPVFSKEAVEHYVEKRPNNKKGRLSIFVTGREEKSENCCYCDEQHKLDRCDKFMEVTLKERIKFLAKTKYCYGCLQPMSDSHNAKTCTRWLSCSSCKGNHPIPLHGYIPKVMKDKADGSKDNSDSGNIKSNYTMLDNNVKCASTTAKSGSKVISMCIVPVKIKHGDSNKMVTTYAMLDKCSQGSFILDSTIKKLGIQGIKTSLKLKTLHGERSESKFAIEGVEVIRVHGDSGWLALPKLYSRREIPVGKEEIETPTKIREWEYLQPISNEIVQNDNVHVGLLIGANCMKALELTRILQSQDGGPYAYKTR